MTHPPRLCKYLILVLSEERRGKLYKLIQKIHANPKNESLERELLATDFKYRCEKLKTPCMSLTCSPTIGAEDDYAEALLSAQIIQANRPMWECSLFKPRLALITSPLSYLQALDQKSSEYLVQRKKQENCAPNFCLHH